MALADTIPPMTATRLSPAPTSAPPDPNLAPTPTPAPRRRRERVSFTVREDIDLTSQLHELFSRAREFRRPMVSKWNQNYRMLRNRYWRPGRPGWAPAPQIPEIWPIVSARVGWMTDQRFRYSASPASLSNKPFWTRMADVTADLEALLESSYLHNNEEIEVAKMCWDGDLYGTAIGKTFWDLSLHNGLGDARLGRVDPFTFYPDPAARSLDDANFFFEARKMSLQEVDRRWPGTARKLADFPYTEPVEESPTQLSPPGTAQDVPRAIPGNITGTGVTAMYGRTSSRRPNNLSDDGVLVIEAWLREHSVIYSDDNEVIGIDDEWRVVVFSGNHVLMDEPATNLWRDGNHPYHRYVPADIGEFWGVSMVELLSPTQESLNRILAAVQQHIELTGNPVLIEDRRAGISRTAMTNRPGQRLMKNAGGDVDWLSPPPIHSFVPEFIRYLLSRLESISGLSAINRGGKVQGRNSGDVIDAMQEAAFVTIRSALRNLESTMRSAGTHKATLIAENYTQPRVASILGPEGSRSLLDLQARHFQSVDTNGQHFPLKFAIEVDAGSRTHTSRKVREDRALLLFSIGVFDEWAVLEALDVPGRANIYKRIMAKKGEQMATDPNAANPPGQRQRAGRGLNIG